MRITDFSMERFGALSKVTIAAIQPGLNVILGANGTGKTTLIEFIRGLFGGFERARRLSLVPQRDTSAGGSVGVEWGSRSLAVIRHSRPDGYETLAINVRHGRPEDAKELRRHLETLDEERIVNLFTAGGFDAIAVDGMLRLAHQDGIDLLDRRNEPVPQPQHAEMRERRRALFDGRNQSGRIAKLAEIRDGLKRDHDALLLARQDELAKNEAARRRNAQAIANAAEVICGHHLDWQAAKFDLDECQDRLWGRTTKVVEDLIFIQEMQATTDNVWNAEVADVDQKIEHVRQVMKDVAESRHRVSVDLINSAGADQRNLDEFYRRQRETLRVMEQQVQALAGVVRSLQHSEGRCSCANTAEQAGSAVDELRRQVELACQEMSRRKSADRHGELASERSALDELEAALERQLHQLLTRRESLLDSVRHPTHSRLAHANGLERCYCECGEHTATTRATTPRIITRQVPRERLVEESMARPGDTQLAAWLSEVVSECWESWQRAIIRANDLELERLVLQACRPLRLLSERIEACEASLAAAEAELAEAQAEWRSLLAAEAEFCTAQQVITWQPSRVVREASERVHILTCGRYRGLRVAPDDRTFVVSETGDETPLSVVSRGTSSQVTLALRLALVDEYARRGIEFPVVLDDVLVDCDEDRLTRAADVLHAAAENGRQVFVLTCQEHFAELLSARGGRVHTLSASGVRSSLPIEAVPARIVEQPRVEEAAPVPSPPVITPPKSDLSWELPKFSPRTESHRCGLQPGSSLRLVPSMTAEASARLEAVGVMTVQHLLSLETEFTPSQLRDLDISRQFLGIWQTEARMLCRIPNLEPRDSQLLVACGVFSADELARYTPAGLYQRIQRFRGSTPQPWHAWVQTRNTWPQEPDLANWISWADEVAHEEIVDDQRTIPLVFQPSSSDDDDPQPPKSGGPNDSARRGRGRKRQSARQNPVRLRRGTERASLSADGTARFFLDLESPIIDAPSIGPKTSKMLQKAGVTTVSHLLSRNASEIAKSLRNSSIDAATIAAWQDQSRLMCQIPELRGHDAQLLVACGYTAPEMIASSPVETLMAKIGPFSQTREGERILRSSKAPDLTEIAAWIEGSRQARALRAA